MRMRVYSVRELSRTFALNRNTLYRAVKRGDIDVTRSPSGWFMGVTDEGLSAWMENMGKPVLARSLAWNRRRTTQRTEPMPETPAASDPTEPIQDKPRQRKNKP
jgi:hypothetical protein